MEAEQILRFVQTRGPAIPNQIKKALQGEITLISAILSELKSAGKIKVSHTKIGGSPTYYVPGQEPKLQNLSQYLNEKDRKAFVLLKEKKVLRDYSLSTLLRVNMRKIKDFAVPLTVNVKGEKEIFWKWYLIDNKEAEEIILEMLGYKKEDKSEGEKEIPDKELPVEEKKSEEEKMKKKTPDTPARPKLKTQEPLKKEEKTLKRRDDTYKVNDDFNDQINAFFKEKNIEVIERKIVRKNSDIEFIIKIPTTVGVVEYFCKAKNKKKCSQGDLSSAYITGQVKKLPVFFITTGEIAKKTREKLNTEFKGMIVNEL